MLQTRSARLLEFLIVLITVCSTGNGEPAVSAELVETGSVSGCVRYLAKDSRPWRYSRYYVARNGQGELAEAVVALEGRTLGKLAPPANSRQHRIDQSGFQFLPETTVIRSGDRVKFTNSDASLHNIRTDSELAAFNLNISQGEEHLHTFKRAGGLRRPATLGCVFHGSMRAWIFVFDHPWYAITARNGQYRLEKIPEGTYTLKVRHPAGGFGASRIIEVRAGKEVRVDWNIPGPSSD